IMSTPLDAEVLEDSGQCGHRYLVRAKQVHERQELLDCPNCGFPVAFQQVGEVVPDDRFFLWGELQVVPAIIQPRLFTRNKEPSLVPDFNTAVELVRGLVAIPLPTV